MTGQADCQTCQVLAERMARAVRARAWRFGLARYLALLYVIDRHWVAEHYHERLTGR